MSGSPSESQKTSRLRHLKTIVWVAIGWIVFTWLLIHNWDGMKQIWQSEMRTNEILMAALLFSISQLCMTQRWMCFLRQQNCSMRFSEACLISILAMLSNYIAFGQYAGVATRVALHAKYFNTPKSHALTAVVLDRLMGMSTFIFAGVVGATVLQARSVNVMNDNYMGILLWFLGLTGCVAVTIAIAHRSTTLQDWALSCPRIHQLRTLVVENTKHRRFIVQALMWSFASQALVIGAFCAVAAAIRPIGWQPSFLQHLTVLPCIELIASVTPTPAGVGVKEFGLTYMYRQFATPPTPADPAQLGLMVALISRAAGFLASFIGLLVFGGIVVARKVR